jgi:hypothetical protein
MLRRLIVLCAAVGIVGSTLGGCGNARPKVRVDLVKKGMTATEVEEILGAPLSIVKVGPAQPSDPVQEWRDYQGDGDHTITVRYKNGKVEWFQEITPRHDWLKVGQLWLPKSPSGGMRKTNEQMVRQWRGCFGGATGKGVRNLIAVCRAF